MSSVAAFSFAQNRRKIPAAHGKALFNITGHGDFGAGARNSIVSGEYPHAASPIVEQEGPTPHGTIGIYDPSRDCYLLTHVAAGIAINPGDTFARRAAGQQNDCRG